MIIDLFNNAALNKEFTRADNYVNQRKFIYGVAKGDIQKHLSVTNPNQAFLKYKQEVVEALSQNRNYIKMCGGSCDNLFSLELLGIEKNSQQYMILADLGNCLDYILHLLSGCSMQNIRNIPNYEAVSNAILNNQFDKLHDITYSILMGIDPDLDRYFEQLYWKINEELDVQNRTDKVILQKFIVVFHSQLLRKLQVVKAYIMAFLRSKDETFRYKSKTFAASLGTSAYRLQDTEVTLTNTNCEDYKITLQTFGKYEYIQYLLGERR